MRCTQLSNQCVIEQTTSDREIEIEIARSGKLIFRSWLFTEFYARNHNRENEIREPNKSNFKFTFLNANRCSRPVTFTKDPARAFY